MHLFQEKRVTQLINLMPTLVNKQKKGMSKHNQKPSRLPIISLFTLINLNFQEAA